MSHNDLCFYGREAMHIFLFLMGDGLVKLTLCRSFVYRQTLLSNN